MNYEFKDPSKELREEVKYYKDLNKLLNDDLH